MQPAARYAAALWGLTLLLAAPPAGAEKLLTDGEMEQFLETAEIGRRSRLSIGITGSQRAAMTDGRLTHDAHIQTVDERRQTFTGVRGVEFNFRDSYLFNVAAYRLDRLINLHMVPVSVLRKVGGKEASVTWWLEDVLMMELDRYKKKIAPTNSADWNDQMYNVRVFNELIYNTDANLGNVLITNDWKIRLVDFTRAFRTLKTLREPKNLSERIDRRIYDGLKSLDEERLTAELADVLPKAEIRAIRARRDMIVAHYDALIAQRGEGAVICEDPGH